MGLFDFFKKKQQTCETREKVNEDKDVKFKDYFLNDRDLKLIVDACTHVVKNSQSEDVLKSITKIAEKLSNRADLTNGDLAIVAACLQAYNEEMSKMMKANPNTTLVPKLRAEKEYLFTVANKMTEYRDKNMEK